MVQQIGMQNLPPGPHSPEYLVNRHFLQKRAGRIRQITEDLGRGPETLYGDRKDSLLITESDATHGMRTSRAFEKIYSERAVMRSQDPTKVASDVFRAFEQDAKQLGIKFSINVQPNLRATFDYHKIYISLYNVVRNAIKSVGGKEEVLRLAKEGRSTSKELAEKMPNKKFEIKISMFQDRDGNIVFEVEDTGLGLHPSIKPEDVFGGVSGFKRMGISVAGSGTAMRTNRQIIETEHGGKMELVRAPWLGGAVFRITIPKRIKRKSK